MKDEYIDKLKRKVGTRLRVLRQDRRLKQEELAQRAQLHPTYVAKIELGERLPSLDAIKRLADALGVPATYIVEAIDEIDEMPPRPQNRLIEELTALLTGLTEEELCFVRDFLELLKQYSHTRVFHLK